MSYQVYRHFDSLGALLYVGCSINSVARLVSHRTTAAWFPRISTITIEHFSSKQEAMDAEFNAILDEEPKFNKNRAMSNWNGAAEVLGIPVEELKKMFRKGANGTA